MKLEGKIINVSPIMSGVSANGKNWQKQDYVLEVPGQYPKRVAFSVMGDRIQQFNLALNNEVEIEIDIDAREWKGKWYNSITCWKATNKLENQTQVEEQEKHKANQTMQQSGYEDDGMPF